MKKHHYKNLKIEQKFKSLSSLYYDRHEIVVHYFYTHRFNLDLCLEWTEF